MRVKTKAEYRARRHVRLRQKISGTAARPRMCVFVSNRHGYVQFVDDLAGVTLASVSSLKSAGKGNFTAAAAAEIGALAAKAAQEKNITAVVFDRGGFTFGKRLQALTEAARKAGLQF